jgi:hypothetical protein
MTLQDAAHQAQVSTAKNSIFDSNMNWWDKLTQVASINKELYKSDKPKTFGTVLNTAMGAALGYGLSKGVGSLFGLEDQNQSNLNQSGAFLGALMGFSKSASDTADTIIGQRRDAFRYGFMKRAMERGFVKNAMNPLSIFIDPIVGAANLSRRSGSTAGTIAGTADAVDETDEDITRMQVERQLLEHELTKLRAKRTNQALKDILAKRNKPV